MYKTKEYEESEGVQQYKDQLDQLNAQRPDNYASQYGDQMQDLMDQYQNRKQFQYDYTADPLYNQYKQTYEKQGKMAMMDTLGQAQTANGGYGSSYGQQVGQQTYNQKLEQLNDRVPELYNLALSRYQQEGADMLNRYNMMSQREQQDYSRWGDQYNRWQNEQQQAQNNYNNERNYDYNRYTDDRDFGFQQYKQDQEIAREQLQWYLDNGITDIPQDILDTSGYSADYIRDRYQEQLGGGDGWDGIYRDPAGWAISQTGGNGGAVNPVFDGKTMGELQTAAEVASVLNAGGGYAHAAYVTGDAVNRGSITQEQGQAILNNAMGVTQQSTAPLPYTNNAGQVSQAILNMVTSRR